MKRNKFSYHSFLNNFLFKFSGAFGNLIYLKLWQKCSYVNYLLKQRARLEQEQARIVRFVFIECCKMPFAVFFSSFNCHIITSNFLILACFYTSTDFFVLFRERQEAERQELAQQEKVQMLAGI